MKQNPYHQHSGINDVHTSRSDGTVCVRRPGVLMVGIICLLVAVSSLSQPTPLCAQFTDTTEVKATWMHRIPDLDIWRSRKNGGYGDWLQYDPVRNRVIYFGGADQCFWTTDPAKAWNPMYNLVWDVTPGNVFWIDMHGNYIFSGKTTYVYYRTTISTDGGETWKVYEPDSVMMRTIGVQWHVKDQNEVYVMNIGGLPVWDYSQRYGALMYSLDNGRTYDSLYFPEGYASATSFTKSYPSTTPEPYRGAWFGPEKFWREYDLRTKETWLHTDFPSMRSWRRLHDGTIVGLGDTSVLIRKGGSTQWTSHSYRPMNPTMSEITVFRPVELHRYDSATVFILSTSGILLSYDVATGTLRERVRPSIETGNEIVQDWGASGRLFTWTVVRLSGLVNRGCTYFTFDCEQGTVDSVTTIGPRTIPSRSVVDYKTIHGPGILALPGGKIVRKQPDVLGELTHSTNNGKVWAHVQAIERTARVPYEYHDVLTVRALNDGRIMARVVDNRIITQPESRDSIWPISYYEASPFTFPASHPNYDNHGKLAYGLPEFYIDDANRVVACGNVVLRWTTEGEFIDTILDKRSIYFTATEFSKLYAAGGDTVWLSFDQGLEWQAVNLNIPIPENGRRASMSSFLELPDGTLLLGLRGLRRMKGIEWVEDSTTGGVWRSTDRGDSWELWNNGMKYDTYVMGMYREPRTGVLFAAASEMVDEAAFSNRIYAPPSGNYIQKSYTIYRSTDDGENWVPTFTWGSLGDDYAVNCSFATGSYGDLNFAVPRTQYIRSFDNGVTWIVPYTIGLDTALINGMCNTTDNRLVFATSKGIAEIDLTISSVPDEVLATYQLDVANEDGEIVVRLPRDDAWQVTISDLTGRTIAEGTSQSGSEVRLRQGAAAQGALAVRAVCREFAIGRVVQLR